MLMFMVEVIELVDVSLLLFNLVFCLFYEEELIVFDCQIMQFGCLCSVEKVCGMLLIYSQKDIGYMINDDGIVIVDCQFCGVYYEFDLCSFGFEVVVDEYGNFLFFVEVVQ